MRKSTEIDKTVLERAVSETFSSGQFSRVTEFAEAVARHPAITSLRTKPLSGSWVASKMRDYLIPMPVQAAPRGQHFKGQPKAPRKRIDTATPDIQRWISAQKDNYFIDSSVIAGILRGSKKSCVKAKCLTCTCGIKSEIKSCTVYSCPLWPIRPFQTVKEEAKV